MNERTAGFLKYLKLLHSCVIPLVVGLAGVGGHLVHLLFKYHESKKQSLTT